MLLSRVRGSLVAGVIGDCIGEWYEGGNAARMRDICNAVNKMEQKWEENKQKEGQGEKVEPLSQEEYTDDTAMARSIAASLVDNQSVNVKDIASRFAKEFAREPHRGYGGNVITVLKALADPNLSDIFQPARKQFSGSGSYGNGGGMRAAPLGLFFHQKPLEDLKESTVKVTALTHTHPHGLMGAILESFAVNLALSLDNSQPLNSNTFLDQLLQRLRPVETELYRKHKQEKKSAEKGDDHAKSEGEEELPYCDKLELIREFLTRDVDVDEVDDVLGTDISALRSVPTAVYCFLRGASKSIPEIEERSEVEQTILYAISLGGDTDTIATMAGAIAGAFFGLDSIPQSWRDSCEGVEDAMIYGEKMVELLTSPEKNKPSM